MLVAAAIVFSRFGAPSPRFVGASPGQPVTSPRSPHEDVTDALLARQAAALAARDRARYLSGWASGTTARAVAARTYANLVLLGVTSISPVVDPASLTEGTSTWSADVNVTWGLTGLDTTTATSSLRYSFSSAGGRALISGVAAAAGQREPVWLLTGLQVRRGDRTLVAGSDPAATIRVERLLKEAVVDVGTVLPGWHGDLVAYVPRDSAEFDALIDASAGQYRGIAAVTTTVDGSHVSSAPTAIIVNPPVFTRLGSIGAHVVVTHEATHAATHAAAVTMPLWVAEGFADYVAIGSVDVSTAVAAKAALHAVRRDGVPAALPDDASFAAVGGALETHYEQAWLATSLIAHLYGQPSLVAFYHAVEAHPDDISAAFSDVLHTSVAQFTVQWQAHLEELAHAG